LEFREHNLANGLSVVAECNPHAVSTSVGFFVRAGARDESDEVSGVSHFLEHMVFKGTPTRTADDVNREFDEMGAHYNAQTSEESTVYYASILPEHQSQAVALWGDILRPSLREEDFNTEKQVIIEEIRMYDDQPPFGAFEKCMEVHFGAHPLHRSVLGTVGSITDLRVDAMRDYFRQRYSPRSITLVGTGQIDFDALISSAEEVAGLWQPFEAPRTTPRAKSHEEFVYTRRESATQTYAVLLANAPAATDEDRYAAKLLATILGDDSGSRMYWELVDPGLVEHASATHYEFEGTGALLTYLSCEPALAAENLGRLADIFRRAQAEGVTQEELDQARSKIACRLVLRGERPRGRLFRVGFNWIFRGQYLPVRDELDSFRAVTIDDIAAVLKKYPPCESTTVAVGPAEELARPER